MEPKKLYTSKVFWVNLITLGGIIAQYATGNEVLDIEAQAIILAVINLVLRIVTNKPIAW